LIAQFLGALVGAGLLVAVYPDAAELGLGANYRAASVSISQAIIGETIATFLLVFVVLETALNERSVAKNNAPIAIGLAVFLAHTTLIPLTGCGINPTRSTGPALFAKNGDKPLNDLWIFWLAPILGSLLATFLSKLAFQSDQGGKVAASDTEVGVAIGDDKKTVRTSMSETTDIREYHANSPTDTEENVDVASKKITFNDSSVP